jgi:hypothetical protein
MNRFLERCDPVIVAIVVMFLACVVIEGCNNCAKIIFQKVEEKKEQ